MSNDNKFLNEAMFTGVRSIDPVIHQEKETAAKKVIDEEKRELEELRNSAAKIVDQVDKAMEEFDNFGSYARSLEAKGTVNREDLYIEYRARERAKEIIEKVIVPYRKAKQLYGERNND